MQTAHTFLLMGNILADMEAVGVPMMNSSRGQIAGSPIFGHCRRQIVQN